MSDGASTNSRSLTSSVKRFASRHSTSLECPQTFTVDQDGAFDSDEDLDSWGDRRDLTSSVKRFASRHSTSLECPQTFTVDQDGAFDSDEDMDSGSLVSMDIIDRVLPRTFVGLIRGAQDALGEVACDPNDDWDLGEVVSNCLPLPETTMHAILCHQRHYPDTREGLCLVSTLKHGYPLVVEVGNILKQQGSELWDEAVAGRLARDPRRDPYVRECVDRMIGTIDFTDQCDYSHYVGYHEGDMSQLASRARNFRHLVQVYEHNWLYTVHTRNPPKDRLEVSLQHPAGQFWSAKGVFGIRFWILEGKKPVEKEHSFNQRKNKDSGRKETGALGDRFLALPYAQKLVRYNKEFFERFRAVLPLKVPSRHPIPCREDGSLCVDSPVDVHKFYLRILRLYERQANLAHVRLQRDCELFRMSPEELYKFMHPLDSTLRQVWGIKTTGEPHGFSFSELRALVEDYDFPRDALIQCTSSVTPVSKAGYMDASQPSYFCPEVDTTLRGPTSEDGVTRLRLVHTVPPQANLVRVGTVLDMWAHANDEECKDSFSLFTYYKCRLKGMGVRLVALQGLYEVDSALGRVCFAVTTRGDRACITPLMIEMGPSKNFGGTMSRLHVNSLQQPLLSVHFAFQQRCMGSLFPLVDWKADVATALSQVSMSRTTFTGVDVRGVSKDYNSVPMLTECSVCKDRLAITYKHLMSGRRGGEDQKDMNTVELEGLGVDFGASDLWFAKYVFAPGGGVGVTRVHKEELDLSIRLSDRPYAATYALRGFRCQCNHVEKRGVGENLDSQGHIRKQVPVEVNGRVLDNVPPRHAFLSILPNLNLVKYFSHKVEDQDTHAFFKARVPSRNSSRELVGTLAEWQATYAGAGLLQTGTLIKVRATCCGMTDHMRADALVVSHPRDNIFKQCRCAGTGATPYVLAMLRSKFDSVELEKGVRLLNPNCKRPLRCDFYFGIPRLGGRKAVLEVDGRQHVEDMHFVTRDNFRQGGQPDWSGNRLSENYERDSEKEMRLAEVGIPCFRISHENVVLLGSDNWFTWLVDNISRLELQNEDQFRKTYLKQHNGFYDEQFCMAHARRGVKLAGSVTRSLPPVPAEPQYRVGNIVVLTCKRLLPGPPDTVVIDGRLCKVTRAPDLYDKGLTLMLQDGCTIERGTFQVRLADQEEIEMWDDS